MLFQKRKKHDRHISQYENIDMPFLGPHDHLIPKDYYFSDTFTSYVENFEKKCKRFLRSVAKTVDRFNAGYMDQSIDRILAEAIAFLDVQQLEHLVTIHELFEIWKADHELAKLKMTDTENAILEVEEQLEKLEKIMYKGTAYE